ISVVAADSDGDIAAVKFIIDGESKGSVSSSPYNFDWSTSGEGLGNHTLKATSIDNEGASTSDEVTIEIIEEEGSAFTASPTIGDAPLTVNFTDQSTNNPTSWNWDFGDGGNSTEQSPSHTYNDMGLYDVTLTATNEHGSDTETKTNFIIVKGTFTDPRDNQTYSIVTIGSQTWFAENLNFETSNSWWYDNSSANGDVYGRLYTHNAATTACPGGWHLPSDIEWKTLEMYLGMSQSEADQTDFRGTDEGKKLKSTSAWPSGDNGTDEVGFTALPGGYRNAINGSFMILNSYGSWWTSTEYGTNQEGGWRRFMESGNDKVARGGYNKDHGFSVRCIRD
ncbi:MAG: PKD domain-containing protein, partial [Bacteroidales bacterium]|nr:PKD domain-containing protein [Bacteroidales bacterium]